MFVFVVIEQIHLAFLQTLQLVEISRPSTVSLFLSLAALSVFGALRLFGNHGGGSRLGVLANYTEPRPNRRLLLGRATRPECGFGKKFG